MAYPSQDLPLSGVHVRKQLTILRLILALLSPSMAFGGELVTGGEVTAAEDVQEAQERAIDEAHAPYQSCAGTSSVPIRVVLDITRGIEKAFVYEGGTLIKSYAIRGGRDRKEYIKGFGNFCSYSTVGEMKPTQLVKDRVSTEHNGAKMPWYVELDEGRGIGAHQGALRDRNGGHSGGCIRQGPADAKWLYEYVAKHSKLYGANEIACSDVTFSIVDNSRVPNFAGQLVPVAEARKECFERIGREDPIRRLEPEFTPMLPRPRPEVYQTGDALPSDHFVRVIHNPEKYQQQYKYLDQGPYPQGFTQSSGN
jgi:hypothetical protein